MPLCGHALFGTALVLAQSLFSPTAARAQTCDLFPIALSARALSNAPPGTILADILNGAEPGNFGWLSWGGSPSEPTLIKSLSAPGDSAAYVNPDQRDDHQVNVGDWVQSKPGVSNSRSIRDALDALEKIDITVPVWDASRGQGADAAYRVSGFARVRVLGYDLPKRNRITAQFLGFVTCGSQNQPPTVNAGPDQTIALPETATLHGSVTDDGQPAGKLSATWTQLSGPGPVLFSQPSTNLEPSTLNFELTTTATFPSPGTYVIRLTATDSELTASDDVIVSVNRENHPPEAAPQRLVTDEDKPVDIVLAGSDADGDALRFTVATFPDYGTLSGSAPELRYTPKPDWNGEDRFTYRVNDGTLDSAPATVIIQVLPVNDPPVADSQSLTNYEDTQLAITLSGSDVEGSPLTYRILTSPANGLLTFNLQPSTSNQWTYQPRTNYFGPDAITFVANDGTNDSAPATIAITVLPVEDPPLVEAGPDQLLIWPTNTVTLTPTVEFDNFPGSVDTVEWSQISGPGTVAFSEISNFKSQISTNLPAMSDLQPSTSATFSEPGVYQLRLTASDLLLSATDDLVVTVDAPPVVDAGTNLTNTWPASAILSGGVFDDGLPTNSTLTVLWSKVSGPGAVLFADPTATNTTASFSESGTYTLRLTANDGIAVTSSDVIVVMNHAPIVDAGSGQVITNLETTLTGTVFDDGLPAERLSVTWRQISGPGAVLFSQPSTNIQHSAYNLQPTTTATFSETGVYTLELSADDSNTVSSNRVTITVDRAPDVDAGPDCRVTLGSAATLRGIVTDDGLPTGSSLRIHWELESGPGQVSIADPDKSVTEVGLSAVGRYVFRLTASDGAASGRDEMRVDVAAANRAPIVWVEPKHQYVLLPATAWLAGSVMDDGLPDGMPLTFSWSKVSGPGAVIFSQPSTILPVLRSDTAEGGQLSTFNFQPATSVSFSEPGDYMLRLTASDSELNGSADLGVTVRNPAQNEAPIVSAGADKVIGLTNVAMLDGCATDDGLPLGGALTVAWSLVSGPGAATFENAGVTNARVTFSAVGAYRLRLMASDSALSSADEVTVTVYPCNQPPIVDAGPAQTVILPDPALIGPNGSSVTVPGVELSRSLLSSPQWDHAIGQSGFDNAIGQNSLAWSGSHLYAAGYFHNSGTNLIGQVACWDGTNWTGLYDPSPHSSNAPPFGFDEAQNGVFPIAARGRDVFVTGGFLKDCGMDGYSDWTARWNGSNWVPWQVQVVSPSILYGQSQILATSNAVYVVASYLFQPTNWIRAINSPAGYLPGLPVCTNIARWDGTNWSSLGGGIPGYVSAVAEGKRGEVYFAGQFQFNTPSGMANGVAMWNGTNWARLGGGITGPNGYAEPWVTGLAVDDAGALYAVGYFSQADGKTVNGIAKWNGASWSALSGTSVGITSGHPEVVVAYGADVYVGGAFLSAGGVPVNHIARWNGNAWSALGQGSTNGFNGEVTSLAANSDGVFIGGKFTTAGGLPANHIAFWRYPDPPSRVVRLAGSVTDDGLPAGSALTSLWVKGSGPGEVTFEDARNPITPALFSKSGSYVLRLSASDGELSATNETTVTIRANQPPSVSAGTNQVIGLGDAAQLCGTVVDDGLPEGAALPRIWSLVYGPGTVVFEDATDVRTSARFGATGAYVLRLTANDSQFSASSDVTIQVVAGNSAPVVHAFGDSGVTFPGPASLWSSVSDDGRPVNKLACCWSQVSGPGTAVFTNANTPRTAVLFQKPGSYVFRLTVNDSQLSASSDLTVAVLPASGNQPPVAYAGSDQEITLPSSASLNAVILDDGPISNLQITWYGSGPGNIVFDDPHAAATTASFSVPGTYYLTLNVSEPWIWSVSSQVKITVRGVSGVNQAPNVYAGPSRTVPIGAVVGLNGTVSDDGLPSGLPLTSTWSLVYGPAEPVFANKNAPATTVQFSATGQYVLQLTASDSELSGSAMTVVTVFDPKQGNVSPTVDAGSPQTVTCPATVNLTGSVSDDGLPSGELNYSWSEAAGPVQVTIDHPYNPNAGVKLDCPGQYVFRLTADDGQFFSGADVVITCLVPTNLPPVVDAGRSRTLMLPATTVQMAGSVSDDGIPAGAGLTCRWTEISGPGPVSFSDPTSTNPVVTFENVANLVTSYGARYSLQLVVTDGQLSATNNVTIVVADPAYGDYPPVVDAGPNQRIILPAAAQLSGSATDSTFPLPYMSSLYLTWEKVSGPGPVNFDYYYQAKTGAHFVLPGQYVLRFTAWDGVQVSADDMIVTVDSPSNAAPIVIAGPPCSIPITKPDLELRGSIVDDGLPVGGNLVATWTQLSGPGTVLFSQPSTNIQHSTFNLQPTTTATFPAAGTYVLRLTGSDSELTNSDNVTVTVFDPTLVNQPPFVYAGPDTTVTLGDLAVLSGVVSDDGLPGFGLGYYWSQVSGPGSAQVANWSATNTTAGFPVPGVYILRLAANDGAFENDSDVSITVLAPTNHAPFVFAGFPQTVLKSDGAVLSGTVIDDGIPGTDLIATWTYISGPGTVTFLDVNAITNGQSVVGGRANFSAAGTYLLRLTASDTLLAASNDVTITVLALDLFNGNKAPIVDAGPPQSAVTLDPIALQGAAVDDGLPSGSRLVTLWSQVAGPALARFASADRTNSTVTFYLPGTYHLRLSASDGQITTVSETTITVVDPTNGAPMVIAGPDVTVTRPNAAELAGVVLDDGLPLGYPLTYQWSKIAGPGAVTFCADGRTNRDVTAWANADCWDAFASATFSAPGSYVLQLAATDTQFTSTDRVTVTVLPGTNSAPLVDAGPDQIVALQNGATLHTDVTDDGLPDGTIEISWQKLSGPGSVAFSTVNGIYHAAFSAEGNYALRLVATDGALTNSDDVNVTAVDAPPPIAFIQNPLDGCIVTAPSNVIGTASSSMLESYVLECRLKLADSATNAQTSAVGWCVLASNTVAVVSNVLGVLDPTLSLNGIYEVRLSVTDMAGRRAVTDPITVIFDRNLKVGNFTISFTDLAIPVAGLPLQITRTYDSRAAAAGIAGDFGIGWTLDVHNVRLQKNRPLGRNWVEYATGSPWDLTLTYHLDPISQRIVTITFPDGKVEKFRLDPDPLDQPLLPIGYPRWRFTPIENTRGTLEPATFDEIDGDFLTAIGAIPGTVGLFDLNYFFESLESVITQEELERYPSLFRYTSPEGSKYLIDEMDGLRSVTDPNGNTLIVNAAGLMWTNSLVATPPGGVKPSLCIAFQRDAAGRITNIVDAAGHAMSYEYDTSGNLARFVSRDGETNSFTYDSGHRMLTLIDGRKIKTLDNSYDGTGRLTATADALGHLTSYYHDVDGRREFVTNRLGFVTINEYDAWGNITRTTDPNGAISSFIYDANGNLLVKSNATECACAVRYTYDDADNRISETDALGNTTTYSYNKLRKIVTMTDPSGFATTNVYDDSGNLLSTRDSAGQVATFNYNELGKVTSMTDPRDYTTRFQYNECGMLTNEVNALGQETAYTVDPNGNLLFQSIELTRVTGLASLQKRKNGWLVAGTPVIIDGPVTMFTRLVMRHEYTPSGQPLRTLYYDGSSSEFRYAPGVDKPASATDVLGCETRNTWDPNGRLTARTYCSGCSETFEYDDAGQVIAQTDRGGHTTHFDYDPTGRLLRTTFADGSQISATYYPDGALQSETSKTGETTLYELDSNRNRVAVWNASGITRYTYDYRNHVTSKVDPLNRTNRYEYDALGRNTRIIYPDGSRKTATFVGRLVASETDQNGNTTSYGYDALGRLISVTNALGQVASYQYDEQGNKIAETDPLNRTTYFEYDRMGHRTGTIYPDGTASYTGYDSAGRVIAETNQMGDVTSYGHDADGHVTAVTNALGFVTRYAYGCAGNRSSQTDPDGKVTIFEYDALNRRIRTAFPCGTTEVLTYDLPGRLVAKTDEAGATTCFEYDIQNRLIKVIDPLTNTTAFAYDFAGNRTFETNALNQVTRLEYDLLDRCVRTVYADNSSRESSYDAAGRLTGRKDQAGKTARFGYDPVGRMISATDASGQSTTFTYDAAGNQVGQTDAKHQTITCLFDVMGRRTQAILPDGSTKTVAYDKAGLPMAVTDADGHDTLLDFDALGRRTGVTDALNHKTRFAYDAMGRLVARTDANDQTTTFEYDCRGRLARTVYPDGSSRSATYDADGRLLTDTDPLGHTTRYTYDWLGRVTDQTDPLGHVTHYTYDALGRLTSRTDANNHTTSYEYDAKGNCTRINYPDGSFETANYDEKGRCIARTDPGGHTTTFAYDDLDHLVSRTNALGHAVLFGYDSLGELTAVTDPNGRTTSFDYDALGRLTRTTRADGSFDENQYDLQGRRIADTDQAGTTRRYAYDILGRLVGITNALNQATLLTYDPVGQLIAQTDAAGHTTSFEYDSLGRRTRRVLPGGQVETLGYDAAGNLVRRTNFNGFATTYVYDELNRLTQKLPDPRLSGAAITFDYDPVGLRKVMSDASGATTYQYDARDRLMAKVTPEGALTYHYDLDGLVTGISSSNTNGAAVSYEYDAAHQLTAANDPRVGRFSYSHDPAGNVEGLAYPNGVGHSYAINSLNWLIGLTATNASQSPLITGAYTRDAAGECLSATETIGATSLDPQSTTLMRSYSYDPLQRLLGETITASAASLVPTGSVAYAYDPVGNRSSRASTLSPIASRTYSYDANDRLATDRYDANGNTTNAWLLDPLRSVTSQVADRFDFEDQLVDRETIADSGTLRIEIIYDGDGNRVRKTVTNGTNITTTIFLVDDRNPTGYPQVLEELSASSAEPSTFNLQPSTPAVTRVSTYGLSLLSQDQVIGSSPEDWHWQVSFYGTDGHGNVRYLTDAAGNITDTYDYDAFGNLIARTGTTPNHYLFAGEQFDPDLGLYYLRARYADPDRGRFWSMDKFGGFADNPMSLHKYAFCQNDPVNRVDPSGYFSIVELNAVYSIGTTIRPMVDQLWNGILNDTHGLAGGDSLKFTSRTEAYMIDSLAAGPGWQFGKPNFWATAKGAPFLLQQNPNICQVAKPCWYECVPFDMDVPVYGPEASNPIFEFDANSIAEWIASDYSGWWDAQGQPIPPARYTDSYLQNLGNNWKRDTEAFSSRFGHDGIGMINGLIQFAYAAATDPKKVGGAMWDQMKGELVNQFILQPPGSSEDIRRTLIPRLHQRAVWSSGLESGQPMGYPAWAQSPESWADLSFGVEAFLASFAELPGVGRLTGALAGAGRAVGDRLLSLPSRALERLEPCLGQAGKSLEAIWQKHPRLNPAAVGYSAEKLFGGLAMPELQTAAPDRLALAIATDAERAATKTAESAAVTGEFGPITDPARLLAEPREPLASLPERAESLAAENRAIRWGPQNGPGPLGADIAATFRGGSYTEVVLSEDAILYRVHGGNSPQIGPYWTRTPPAGPLQSAIDSALNPAWGNTARNVVTIRVPRGTTVYEGFAAPQGSLVGGGSQVVIPQVTPAWIVK